MTNSLLRLTQRLTQASLVAGMLCIADQQSLAQNWVRVRSGVERASFGTVVNAESLYVNAIRLSGKPRIEVIHVYSFLEQKRGQYFYNLDEVFRRANPILAINGGFSRSSTIPTAAGLLRSNGNDIVPLNTQDSVQDGLLCISGPGQVRIRRVRDYRPLDCPSALQAGPLLVFDGRELLDERELTTQRHHRSVLCINDSGNVIFITTPNAVHLYTLAVTLADDRGLHCKEALNLSGSTQSGLMLATNRGPFYSGYPRTPVASAIVVNR